MTRLAKTMTALVCAALAVAGCNDDNAESADPCEELETATEEDPDAVAADADEPDNLIDQCMDKLVEDYGDLSEDEKKELFGDP